MRILPQEALQRLTPRGVIRKAKNVAATTPIEFVREVGDNEFPTLYFFRKGTQGIIAPADDAIRPILADCDTADWTVELPPNLIDWLGEYDREITYYQTCCEEGEVPETGDSDGRVSVSPLIKTTWAQGSPFNDRLVFDDGKHSLVGCNAVSLGQILYYWGVTGVDGKKYHRGCIKTTAYTTKTNGYRVASLPAITRFDYDNLTQKAPTGKDSIKAVSTLLEYCGKSITSNYAPGSTAASPTTAARVLTTHFRMGDNIRMIYASSGEAKFAETVYNELVNRKPVIINGYHASGGHSFICDGYDAATGRFHFNFGWGGSYNGYFAMTAINVKNTYNSNKNATIGIQPDYILGDVNGDGNIDISDVTAVTRAVLNDNYNERSDVNSDKSVTIADATTITNHILGKKKL